MPWGVDFGDGLMRHPTQLYEAGFVWLLGIILWRHSRGPYNIGDLFKMFMVAYFGFRLVCDFLKPEVRVFAGLSAIQWVCSCILIYYAKDVVRWMRSFVPAAHSEQKIGET
jgi:prolipoprotein diacylglyceryltransferase